MLRKLLFTFSPIHSHIYWTYEPENVEEFLELKKQHFPLVISLRSEILIWELLIA